MKRALVTGVTGQDGSYLAEFLLERGYEVHGMRRRSSSFNTSRIEHIYSDPHESKSNFYLHHGDMTDSMSLNYLIGKIQPDEVYNLAAQSHVAVSFETPEYTANTNGLGALRLFEAVRLNGLSKRTKIYHASTSELFGKVIESPQSEKTPFIPRSPYGIAKLFAHWTAVNYREAHEMYISTGILFNHESPRRGELFVTRKITRGLARVKLGKQECVYLGNLDSLRDWGHARDYVEMQWKILQLDEPNDFVIATGMQYSVRDFATAAAAAIGVDLKWTGEGLSEFGSDSSGKIWIKVDPAYFRPTEVDTLLGDASKAKKLLGWIPKVSFESLVSEMMKHDLLIESKKATAS